MKTVKTNDALLAQDPIANELIKNPEILSNLGDESKGQTTEKTNGVIITSKNHEEYKEKKLSFFFTSSCIASLFEVDWYFDPDPNSGKSILPHR